MQSEPGAVATGPKSPQHAYPVATAPGSDLIRLEFRPMKIADESITLRPVSETDKGFLIELYKSSRGDDLRGLGWSEDRISEFLEMQYEAQGNLKDDNQQASDQVVLMNGNS